MLRQSLSKSINSILDCLNINDMSRNRVNKVMTTSYGVVKLGEESFLCSIRKNGMTIYNRFFKTLEEALFAYNQVVLEERLPLPLNKIVQDEQIFKYLQRSSRHKKASSITYEYCRIGTGWSSLLRFGKYLRFLGVYDSPDEAIKAYNDFVVLRGIRAPLIKYVDALKSVILHNKEVLLGYSRRDLIVDGPPLTDWLKII